MGNIITGSGASSIAASFTGEYISLKADASNPILVHSIRIGQYSDAGDSEAEMLQVRLSRYTGVQGTTGGSAGQDTPHEVGGPVTGANVHVGSTALSATGVVVILEDSFNVQAGWLYLPTPEERIWIAPGEGLAAVSPAGPADALSLTASITYEEIMFAA